MSEERYRELLEAAPAISRADVEAMRAFVLRPKRMVMAVLTALASLR
jgi:hypothetical protein